jgi:hypothetical protein
MLTKFARTIEVLANFAIIGIAILIGVLLVKTYWRTAPVPTAQAPSTPIVGTKPAVLGVDWQKNGRTLLLVLQKNCHFCTDSALFYQRLTRELAGHDGLRLVAVLPQQVEEGRQYLNGLGVTIDEVRQVSPANLGVSGTPTLVLVDSAGVATDAWVGKLTPDREGEVLSRLKS